MKESTAMLIGRDDYKARPFFYDEEQRASFECPFRQGSADAAEWLEGWTREEMRNPKSEMSKFQKVKAVMEGTA